VEGQSFPRTIDLFRQDTWIPVSAQIVGLGPATVDVAVLTVDRQLSPTFPLEPSMVGMVWGQDVYFLGFPYGLFGNVGSGANGFPLPFIKKATLSAIGATPGGPGILFLDGHNNPGFSGGPVVYKRLTSDDWCVASVISGYRFANEPVYQGVSDSGLVYRENTGIIVSHNISHAMEIINANPIGFALPRTGA
jgi:hypothetical protein